MKVWVVTEHNDDEDHHKVIGVFDNYKAAKYAIEIEVTYYQGLYYYETERFCLASEPDQEKIDWYKK